jgi:hypothetical protein
MTPLPPPSFQERGMKIDIEVAPNIPKKQRDDNPSKYGMLNSELGKEDISFVETTLISSS